MTAIGNDESSPAQDALFMQLVRAAGQAPSPDNNQPWAFRRVPEGIEVWHCRERALPSDARDLFSWIAIGAAIENIALRASANAQRADVLYQSRPFPTVNGMEHVATVRLAGNGTPDPLNRFIEERVTNRRLYRREPLAAAELDSLSAAIRNPHDQVSWIVDSADRVRVARLVAACDRIRFEHRPFHEEFHNVLRYSEAEARRTGDGLELKTLELPPGAGLLMRWLRPWNRMCLANRFGMSRMFAGYSIKQIARSGAVGLLTTSHASDSGYLEAGRSLQRLWLAATQLGLAFQPMGALPLFLTKLADEGENGFDSAKAARLEHIRQALGELVTAAADQEPVMLFRVGRGPAPSARSGRYPADRIVVR